jgi:hypothetical protein
MVKKAVNVTSKKRAIVREMKCNQEGREQCDVKIMKKIRKIKNLTAVNFPHFLEDEKTQRFDVSKQESEKKINYLSAVIKERFKVEFLRSLSEIFQNKKEIQKRLKR